ncbi:MAG: CHAT domain-containing protein [Symplocastrum torsivum CPER-KK1]|jgi:CHAT domain-containing protein|uniref:CHAT domain-containing protein n=1 Tax=Symplocastrum torsivum CPER-KK1 TaxID=450513 RepID=A0A951PQX8_9CYAN|nr:CHAT domain-containing protein [Symplocastrum torsivum CPER-KK1]
MARKQPVFFSRVNLLNLAQAVASLTFLAGLGVGITPAWAQVPTTPPLVQTLPDALELDKQGRDFYDTGQFNQAVKVWQQAATTFEAQGDKLRQAMTLSNLSLAYQQMGEWSLATKIVEDSLNLLQVGQNPANSKDQLKVLAQALEVQGRLQLARGQAQAAQSTWQKATDTYAQVGDDVGVIRSRINQTQALRSLGLYRRALSTLTEVEQTLQKQPDSPLKASGLRNLGNVFRVVGNLKNSQEFLQQSRELAERLRSPQDLSMALFSMGNTARASYSQFIAIDNQKQAELKAQEALAFYQQAITTATSPTTKLQAQLNQLSLLVDTEQVSAAQTLLPQIQSQLTNSPPSRTVVYGWIDLAQSLMKLSALSPQSSVPPTDIAQMLVTSRQQAKSLGDRRVESYALGHLGELYEMNGQESEAIDLTQQALNLAQMINAPEITNKWQWQLGRLLKAQGDRTSAIAAYTEAVNTLKSLRSDLVAINPDIQFSFRESVEPVYRQLVGLLLESEGGSQPSQDNLKQAREVIESLQLAELDNFFRENCLDVKQQVDQIDEKAAVIYPILLDDRLEVILSLPGQNLRHYATPVPPQQVESLVEELRQNLLLPYTSEAEIQPQAQKIYNWLIQPAQTAIAQSGIETLVFVLDGPLRNLPMAVLYDGKQYLVEKYSIALTPGLQLVDPRPLPQRQLKALTAGLSESRRNFAPLEFVESELEQIKSEIPSDVLLNQQFTSTTLDNKINSSPVPVVHLATHGQFSSQAEETFILAWDKPINVNELDQLLRTIEQSQSGTLELLVLSACETAAGDKRAALGLAGVAVRAGARSTLASLWLVDDESTALLMSHFYQELKTGVSKAEALRRAQLVLLQGKYQHPRLWAAFVLLGNWL